MGEQLTQGDGLVIYFVDRLVVLIKAAQDPCVLELRDEGPHILIKAEPMFLDELHYGNGGYQLGEGGGPCQRLVCPGAGFGVKVQTAS